MGNIFLADYIVVDDDEYSLPAKFLSTLYNLKLGFQDKDELDALEITMHLEEVLNETTEGFRRNK